MTNKRKKGPRPASPKPTAARPSPSSTAEQVDRALAVVALDKRRAGQHPTRPEAAALKRFEKACDERLRWEHYRAVPARHYIQMAGRPAQIVNAQAVRYGVPFGGSVVNLENVVRGFHDFLARNARRLSGVDDDPDMSGGDGSPSLELYRAERAKLARLERLEREQVLTRIEDVNETLTRILSVIRGAGELLQRQFGPEAHAVLDDAIDALIREIPNWTFEGDLYAEQETTSHAAS